jgi:hypothetical protein
MCNTVSNLNHRQAMSGNGGPKKCGGAYGFDFTGSIEDRVPAKKRP